MANIAIPIQHTTKIANGRNILGTAGKFIVDLLRRGYHHVQVRVQPTVDGLEAFSLRNEIGIGQDDEINVADPVKVLVVDFSDGLCREIGTSIVGNKFIIAFAHHLKTQGGTAQLAFDDRWIAGVANVPNLRLLRRVGESEIVGFGDHRSLRITEKHLSARERQTTPSVDNDIVHIALRIGIVAQRVVFQRNTHRFANRLRSDPSAHIVAIGTLGRRRSGSDIVGGFLIIVDQHLEIGRLEIAPRQSRLDPTRAVCQHIGETEIKVLCRGKVHFVAIIRTTDMVQIIVIVFMHAIIQELVDNLVGVSCRRIAFADTLSLP